MMRSTLRVQHGQPGETAARLSALAAECAHWRLLAESLAAEVQAAHARERALHGRIRLLTAVIQAQAEPWWRRLWHLRPGAPHA